MGQSRGWFNPVEVKLDAFSACPFCLPFLLLVGRLFVHHAYLIERAREREERVRHPISFSCFCFLVPETYNHPKNYDPTP